MDNRKKRNKYNKNKNKNNNNNRRNQAEKTEILKTENSVKEKAAVEKIPDANMNAAETEISATKAADIDSMKAAETEAANIENSNMETDNVETLNAELPADNTHDTETVSEEVHKSKDRTLITEKEIISFTPEHVKTIIINALKILLPVAACAIVIAVIISYAGAKKSKNAEAAVINVNVEENPEISASMAEIIDKPLEENAHADVNEMINKFYQALADGDMDVIRAIKDYNDDVVMIAYEKKSELIESYDNIVCYTKPGLEENSYFVYVSYEAKIKDIETKAPGLNAFYVYTAEDGNLKIDGNMEENIDAAFKLVTSQEDVVDLYNRIDVIYKEVIASDAELNVFMKEFPTKFKTTVGETIADKEDGSNSGNQEETSEAADTEQTAEIVEPQIAVAEEHPQNQTVNQIVKATDTVNVRSSDSEQADKIGKVQAGTELTRTEERVNGWSKVVYEGKEAYIKSDYLEVVSSEEVPETVGTVKATTNVNVRSQANQDSEKLGTAQAGNSYDLIEDKGEWYKISYNGKTGYVKAEFFEK